VRIVALPRNDGQARRLREQWPDLFASGTMRIPEHVVDGLNLIWHSDLVISGGGTMNREAAALGVPVYSVFRGHIGAVDRYLSSAGRLVLLESVDDVRTKILPVPRHAEARGRNDDSAALTSILQHIDGILQRPGSVSSSQAA
jgi:uncharacterized protein